MLHGFFYDSDEYYLGRVCSQHHNWLGSGFSLKRNQSGECRDCLDEIKYWDEYHNWLKGNLEGTRKAPRYRKRMLQARISQFNGSCAFCGQQGLLAIHYLEFPVTCDLESFDNLVPTCYSCYNKKVFSGTKKTEDWYKQQVFYSQEKWKFIQNILTSTKEIKRV